MDAKVRGSLTVGKQEAQKFDGERFNLGKLNELEIRKQCQIDITNRFTPLGNLSDDEDINRAGGTLKRIFKPHVKKF